MSSFQIRAGLIGIALVLILAAILYASLNSMLQKGIEMVAPKVTGTAVTVEAVSVSPMSGQGSIRGLVVRNPSGFRTESAFRLAETRIRLVPMSLFSDKVLIREIVIDGPAITYESGSPDSNLGRIQKNAEAFGGAAHPPSSKSASRVKDELRFEITRLILRNAHVSIVSGMTGGKPVELVLPEVRLENLGKGTKGVTAGEAVSKLLAALTIEVTRRAVSAPGLDKVTEQLRKKGFKGFNRLLQR